MRAAARIALTAFEGFLELAKHEVKMHQAVTISTTLKQRKKW